MDNLPKLKVNMDDNLIRITIIVCAIISFLAIYSIFQIARQQTNCDRIKKYKGDVVDPAVNINKLVLNKENNWKGWACWVGIDTITINRTGDIKIGSGCNPDLVLGNISNLNFKFQLIPVRCRYDTCSCFADIATTKIKNYDLPMIFK